MFRDFYHAFYYSLLIAATVLCILFFKNAQRPFRLLAVLVVLTLLSELTAKYVAYILHNNNMVYHFFTPVEFLFYVLIYQQFFSSKKWNYILWLCFAILVFSEIFNTIFFQPLNVDNTNILILESIFLVAFSLSLFIKISESEYHQHLLKEGIFWFNSAVLFYYAFNILIWGFHSIQVYNLKNPPMFIYNFILVFSGLLYAIYAFATGLNSIAVKKRRLNHE